MKTSAHTSHECFYFQGQPNVFSGRANALFFKRYTVKCFSKIILSPSEDNRLQTFLFSPCCCKIRFEQLWKHHNGVGLSHLLAFSTLINKCLFLLFFLMSGYTLWITSHLRNRFRLVCSWFTTIPLMAGSMLAEAWRAQTGPQFPSEAPIDYGRFC